MQLQFIQKKIYEIREQKVMLDFDLAELYEVETRVLKQAVRRNIDIFPNDFMFQLTRDEWKLQTSQFVMFEKGQGKGRYPKFLPFAFTEHGVTMLANVLKSKKARQTSVSIVRAFIALKQFVINYKELAEKMKELESKYNKQFADVYEALKYLMDDKQNKDEWEKRKQIGFKINS